jgi:death-on-curing protein
MDLFDMAAAYLVALAFRHPFLDGNKRTAAAAALTFLHLNGYDVNERHPEELADLVLSLLRKEVDREDVGQWFRDRSAPHESAEPS